MFSHSLSNEVNKRYRVNIETNIHLQKLTFTVFLGQVKAAETNKQTKNINILLIKLNSNNNTDKPVTIVQVCVSTFSSVKPSVISKETSEQFQASLWQTKKGILSLKLMFSNLDQVCLELSQSKIIALWQDGHLELKQNCNVKKCKVVNYLRFCRNTPYQHLFWQWVRKLAINLSGKNKNIDVKDIYYTCCNHNVILI